MQLLKKSLKIIYFPFMFCLNVSSLPPTTNKDQNWNFETTRNDAGQEAKEVELAGDSL